VPAVPGADDGGVRDKHMKAANRVTKRKALRIPEVSREGPYTFDDLLEFGDTGRALVTCCKGCLSSK
jgi:hypothetical protein